MTTADKLLELYAGVLGDVVVSSRVENGTVILYIEPTDIREVLTTLRDDQSTALDILSVMTAVDYFPREPRFEMMYELYSTGLRHRARVKAKLPHTGGEYDLAQVDTVSDIYLTANWHERECYDLMGINFKGHPDQRRILLPEGWDGYPLRKEYPYDGKREWQLGTSVDDGVRSDGNLGLEQG